MSSEIAKSKLVDMEAEADRLHAEMYAATDDVETPEVLEQTDPDTVDAESSLETEADQPAAEELKSESVDEPATEESSDDSEPDSETALQSAEKRIKDAQRRMTKATQEAASLRRENDTLRDRLTTLSGEVGQLKAQTRNPEVSNEDLNHLKEEYPDLANPLIAKLNELQAELAGFKSQSEEMRNHSQTDATERARLEHQNAILSVHPDAFELAQTDPFRSWLEDQPAYKRQVVEAGSSEDVVDLLNEFKSNLVPKKPAQTLDQAKEIAEPKTRSVKAKPEGKKTWTAKEIHAMPLSDYVLAEKEIDQAWREGRVIS